MATKSKRISWHATYLQTRDSSSGKRARRDNGAANGCHAAANGHASGAGAGHNDAKRRRLGDGGFVLTVQFKRYTVKLEIEGAAPPEIKPEWR